MSPCGRKVQTKYRKVQNQFQRFRANFHRLIMQQGSQNSAHAAVTDTRNMDDARYRRPRSEAEGSSSRRPSLTMAVLRRQQGTKAVWNRHRVPRRRGTFKFWRQCGSSAIVLIALFLAHFLRDHGRAYEALA